MRNPSIRIGTIHHGALVLRVEGDAVTSLTGEYWTDRLNCGQISFSEKSEVLYFNFATAAAGSFNKLGDVAATTAIASDPGPAAPIAGRAGDACDEKAVTGKAAS